MTDEKPKNTKPRATKAQQRQRAAQAADDGNDGTPQNVTQKPEPTPAVSEINNGEVDAVFGAPFRHLVVHCKHSPFDVYVGRPSKGSPAAAETTAGKPNPLSAVGVWGNPFRMRRDNPKERKRVVERYREYLLSKPELVLRAKAELRGKVLACWCSPKSCHAHVLAAVANDDPSVTCVDDACARLPPPKIQFRAQLLPVSKSPAPGDATAGNHRACIRGGGGGGEGKGRAAAASAAQPSGKPPSCPPTPFVGPEALIDIGVNLTNKLFKQDAGAVVARASAAGVSPLIVTGTSLADSRAAQLLCKRLGKPLFVLDGVDTHAGDVGLYFTAGVHPHNANTWVTGGKSAVAAAAAAATAENGTERSDGGGGGGALGTSASLRAVLSDPLCVAVGECGLDFNRDYSPRHTQVKKHVLLLAPLLLIFGSAFRFVFRVSFCCCLERLLQSVLTFCLCILNNHRSCLARSAAW
mmetsp:Transcript_32430/g.54621  ORF Transcript_32430/g.54621 Transcript_32430/m.54621 type:complete len:467 (-) Transcript_32430:443-1843(-)